MRKLFLLLFSLCTIKAGFNQVIITSTLGTTTPTPYPTLSTALDAVNNGIHQGIVTITINTNTIETNTAILNASGSGSAIYSSLSLKPGAGPVIISGSIAGPLIDLNGADNVVIDGLNNGDASLIISNTSTATTASTIRFTNDATADIIQNATISGASTSVTTGTVVFGNGALLGNDNNLIANCTISDAAGNLPVNAIYSSGNVITSQENSGITIHNNHISNFFNADVSSTGILIAMGNTDWTISTNRFFQTAARTFTTGLLVHRAIQIAVGNNYSIIGNTIGYASAAGTGIYTLGGTVTTRYIAIDLAVGTTVASSVQNNTITNFSFATSNTSSSASGIWCAISITSGNVNVGTATGNIIGNTSGTGAITINPTVAGTLTVAITSSSTGNVNINNNSIGGIDVLPSGVFSGNLMGIQSQGASGNIVISNNTIGNAIPNNMRVGVLGTTTGNGIIRGILNTNAGTILLANNTIQNLTHNSSNALSLFRAIECQQGVATITRNTINNITANGTSVSVLTAEGAGILATTSGAGLLIDQNTISNLNVINSSTANGITVIGIYLGSGVNGVSVTRNKIYGFTNASTSTSVAAPGVIAGIYCRDAASANPNILVANNMISFGRSQNSNTAIVGIWNQTMSTNGLTTKVYYNSVHIEGTVTTGAQPSFCYYRGDFSATPFTSPVIDLKNNIFTNMRSGGAGYHYAIANSYVAATSSAGGWGTNASNYNVLHADPASIGYWSGNKTFTEWQTVSAGDLNSLSGINLIYANAATGDLHLTNTVDIVVDGKATPLAAVTNDFDNNIRNLTTPDIGADEFDAGSLPIIIEYFTGKRTGSVNAFSWKAGCSLALATFEIERSSDGRSFHSIEKITATQARCSQPFSTKDATPMPGINYYRLKMTDADGTVSYSHMIAILNKDSGFEVLGLSSTIVDQGRITMNTMAAQPTSLHILVTDATGRVINKQARTVVAGSSSIQIDVSKLANGVYLLTYMANGSQWQTFRFIKQ